uniref:Uncharacterized protein n=1 Tax=viral metagenome TaxID=1070528 RepID=A0A6M3L508_9ZZZZ
MYRITIYDKEGEKSVLHEGRDEDELRDMVESCVNDLENKEIRSFVVSRVSGGTFKKPFWEK